MRRSEVVWASSVALVFALTGCSRKKEEAATPKYEIKAIGAAPQAPAEDPEAAEKARRTQSEARRILEEWDGSPPVITQTITIDGGRIETPPDPDLPIVDAARMSAAQCFTSLPIPEGAPTVRRATVRVNVVPTGSVSRAEVSSSETDTGLIDCLKHVGEGLHFTSRDPSSDGGNELRSFTIDVAVSATR